LETDGHQDQTTRIVLEKVIPSADIFDGNLPVNQTARQMEDTASSARRFLWASS